MEVLKMAKIVRGKTSFLSRGYCSLVVFSDGKETQVDLPIKSTGLIEFQAKLDEEAPTPPTKMEVVKKDSDVGKQMGLEEDTPMRVFDLTDETYLKAVQEFQRDFMWRTAIHALDVEFEDEGGNAITGYEEKKAALQETGISGHHLTAIMEAVASLTKAREAKADFLSGKPLA
jgi:hypothetical protein